jgi:hypothetical protein
MPPTSNTKAFRWLRIKNRVKGLTATLPFKKLSEVLG